MLSLGRLEVDAIAHELKGGAKTAESFGGAIRGGMAALRQNFGSVKVVFGDALSIQDFVKETRAAPGFKPDDPKALGRALANDVINRMHQELVVSPTAIVSTLLIDAAQPASM
eukprot:SAG22_NODE_3391_length_1736_cov_2.588271_5_plen_112_part_01